MFSCNLISPQDSPAKTHKKRGTLVACLFFNCAGISLLVMGGLFVERKIDVMM
jgi:hypothetical protein